MPCSVLNGPTEYLDYLMLELISRVHTPLPVHEFAVPVVAVVKYHKKLIDSALEKLVLTELPEYELFLSYDLSHLVNQLLSLHDHLGLSWQLLANHCDTQLIFQVSPQTLHIKIFQKDEFDFGIQFKGRVDR